MMISSIGGKQQLYTAFTHFRLSPSQRIVETYTEISNLTTGVANNPAEIHPSVGSLVSLIFKR